MDYRVIERTTKVQVDNLDLRVMGRSESGEGRTVAPALIVFTRMTGVDGLLVAIHGPKVKADGEGLSASYFKVHCRIGDVGAGLSTSGVGMPEAPLFIQTIAKDVQA